ncbi:MAG: hypothetical protein WC556_07685 [Candidatus Methanoperedens sp.]
MRKLFLIRIVHTATDMGSMSDGLMKEGMAKIGKEKWLLNQKKIEQFWDDLEKEIDGLDLDYSRTRIYQDGLPCSGDMGLRIVRETAEKGSRNYQIVRKLIERGGAIEATENPQLLRKEYEHIKALLTAQTNDDKIAAANTYDMIKDELIHERDAYIAKAIDISLKDDETGVLFIGAFHNVLPLLAKDIEVKSLD